jgi:uncharacterized protein YbjT (DUF2867 family)
LKHHVDASSQPPRKVPDKGKRMNVIIFGATGMVGQAALRECLLDPEVKLVLSIVRKATGQRDAKLRELVHSDLFDYSGIQTELTGFDACFFCIGVTSAGMSEAQYTRVTHDLTLAAATTLAKLNPSMTFIYVSGAGTDSTEHGRTMWARVKGKTENDILKLPFKAAYMFRPGFIQPLHGIVSKTTSYRIFYSAVKPFLPLMRKIFPTQIGTTEQIGRAMLLVVKHGFPRPVLESKDINTL